MSFKEDILHGKISRRDMIGRMGTSLMGITLSTALGPMSPQKARAQGVALRTLNPTEGRTLEALGNILLPGAREAGIAHYVDDQLSRKDPLFVLKYMDFSGTDAEFYKLGLQSLERVSLDRYGKSFESNTVEQNSQLIQEFMKKNPDGWSGPPAPLFYFVTRNDAVDVVYGTQEGFEKLSIPYMAHIMPPQKW